MTIAKYIGSSEFHELSRPNDLRAGIDLLVRLSLFVGLLAAIIASFPTHPFLSIIVWYLFALQLSFWGYAGLGHEAFHKKVFSNKKLNAWLFVFCSAVTWSNGAFFERSHLYHHKNTFAQDDFEAHSEQSWSWINLVAYASIDFRLMKRRVLYAALNTVGYFPNLTKIQDKSIVSSARSILLINALFLLSVYALSDSLLITTIVFLSPFSGTLLNKVLAKAQHHNLDAFKSDGPLAHSRTVILPKLIGFLYANMNYHAEHHLAPSIPYYNLPRLHKILHEGGHVTSCSLYDFIVSWLTTARMVEPALSEGRLKD
ncbi:MAG: fatty acid desaturase [Roseomonas sp.]|nr:fatty acid desaturase [Roseomonas sp.]MCA3328380.1 fatty acid desaturase [Roseomonas sp.]MCA3330840.1 fatty acid desaturase [Roseomonas sp.]MCA3333923.1 fatty acid desaturase [Roseomonas sp.]MCA3348282.1 fatty acid desaturase [Roseomonas sp.]